MNRVLVLPIITALVCVISLSTHSASASSVVIPYGSSWEGPNTGIANGATMPYGDQAGSGPGGTQGFTCSGYNFNTYWIPDSVITLTKHFTLSSSSDLVVDLAIDNDVQISINGHDITGGLTIHDGCAFHHNAEYTAPSSDTNTGDNVITVTASDRGIVDLLDIQVTANTSPSIPEFPFAYSLVIMFVVIAAAYMSIRLKMTNFKRF